MRKTLAIGLILLLPSLLISISISLPLMFLGLIEIKTMGLFLGFVPLAMILCAVGVYLLTPSN